MALACLSDSPGLMAQHRLLSSYIDVDGRITRIFGIDETAYKKLAVIAE
jgi:hypothetical protein